MRAATTLHRDMRTFSTHIFSPGLDADRHIVERFRSVVNGEIRRRTSDEPLKKVRCKAEGDIMQGNRTRDHGVGLGLGLRGLVARIMSGKKSSSHPACLGLPRMATTFPTAAGPGRRCRPWSRSMS